MAWAFRITNHWTLKLIFIMLATFRLKALILSLIINLYLIFVRQIIAHSSKIIINKLQLVIICKEAINIFMIHEIKPIIISSFSDIFDTMQQLSLYL
jgi:hypothetical protein